MVWWRICLQPYPNWLPNSVNPVPTRLPRPGKAADVIPLNIMARRAGEHIASFLNFQLQGFIPC